MSSIEMIEPTGLGEKDGQHVVTEEQRRIPISTVTISPRFQVVIPKDVRDELSLEPGQKVQAIAYNNRIVLIPVRPLRRMRGFVKGIETDVLRSKRRRTAETRNPEQRGHD